MPLWNECSGKQSISAWIEPEWILQSRPIWAALDNPDSLVAHCSPSMATSVTTEWQIKMFCLLALIKPNVCWQVVCKRCISNYINSNMHFNWPVWGGVVLTVSNTSSNWMPIMFTDSLMGTLLNRKESFLNIEHFSEFISLNCRLSKWCWRVFAQCQHFIASSTKV